MIILTPKKNLIGIGHRLRGLSAEGTDRPNKTTVGSIKKATQGFDNDVDDKVHRYLNSYIYL